MTQTQLSDDQFAIIAQITVKLAALGHEVTFQHPIADGPLVTTYRFQPKGQAKVRQLESLSSDLALALAVEDVLIRRIPGEAVIGITVPNKTRRIVQWRDTIVAVCNTSFAVPLNFGVDALGRPMVEDLTVLPHLLIAGSTGGGKSTLLSSLIASLIYAKSSDEVQFVLCDTKKVEFGQFKGTPHLVCDPLKSVYEVMEKMDWLSDEVANRLKKLEIQHVKNIKEYNLRYLVAQNWAPPKLPYLILVIDELFHLLGGSRGESKVASEKIARIVSESRAAGIHVIGATQRPSVDVVTGSIKANFPARLSFRLPSESDSRTVLGTPGAEHLLSQGDMLYQSPSRPGLTRCHSAWVSDSDVKAAIEASSFGQWKGGRS